MADTFDDAEFGTFTFDNFFWQLSRPVSLNDVKIPVYFDTGTDEVPEISLVEREAFRQLFSFSPDTLQSATPFVFQNYKEIYKQIEEQDPEYLEYLPKIDNLSEIWQFVELSEFVVMEHGDITIPTFFLDAECEWEEEHGLRVRFRNGMADAAADQGGLYLED